MHSLTYNVVTRRGLAALQGEFQQSSHKKTFSRLFSLSKCIQLFTYPFHRFYIQTQL